MENNATITGITKLDEILDGELKKGALYLIASQPNYGKTSFAIQTAASIAESEKKVFFCSLGMIKEQIKDRLAKQGKENVSIVIEDRSGITPCEIKEMLIAQNAEVAIIDYLGLIYIDGKFENRRQEITEITRQLKVIAKELQIPIICLSQLSRRAMFVRGKGHIPRPKLPEDLRVFGSIEQDCDVIIFLHREEDATDSNVEIIVARNRYGQCGTIEATFDKERLLFTEKE
ncbi:MAG: DnaB-like helicase C-terminal domain-containing protein [Eubacterium sp.]|nr:DnaB-like helicase C-terminal domain-containing protein [Eubacterium sp.]